MVKEKFKENMSLSVQFVVLLIFIALFSANYYKIFINEKHNLLCLCFSFVTLAWLSTMTLRYFTKKADVLAGDDWYVLVLPKGLKCLIGDKNCESGNMNIWSIFHFISYTIIGIFVPDCFIEIIFFSIGCELVESAIGSTSKMIVDPIVNMLGYILGSAIARNYI